MLSQWSILMLKNRFKKTHFNGLWWHQHVSRRKNQCYHTNAGECGFVFNGTCSSNQHKCVGFIKIEFGHLIEGLPSRFVWVFFPIHLKISWILKVVWCIYKEKKSNCWEYENKMDQHVVFCEMCYGAILTFCCKDAW